MLRTYSDTARHLFRIGAPPLILTAVLYLLHHTSPEIAPYSSPRILALDEKAQCLVDFTAADACELVDDLCSDFDNDGLIPYLHLYACAARTAQPFLLVAMVLWLGVVFGSMATTAAEFMAPHLEFIVQKVGISENLAGVTIFAFGNGCTDLFATLAAMGAHNDSLAISELFGAAAFITTVVLGAIALIQPFSVDPRIFVGDVVWFIVAASLLITFLADGELLLVECAGIIGLYVAYALFAILRPRSNIDLTASAVVSAINTGNNARDEDNNASETSRLLGESEEDTNDARSDNSHATDATYQGSDPACRIMPDSAGAEDEPGTEVDSDDRVDNPLPRSEQRASMNEVTLTARKTSILHSFPPLQTWYGQSIAERSLTAFSTPLLLFIGITTPPPPKNRETAGYPSEMTRTERSSIKGFVSEHWFLCLQLLLGPQLFALVIISQSFEDTQVLTYRIGCTIALVLSTSLIIKCFVLYRKMDFLPRGQLVISILAFAISLIWIYLTATSAVTLLTTLALILDIPTALLGGTVFAIGQSSNDLVANTAVARRGMPVLAASATFGGPMMNMFLGIGGGGLIQVLRSRASGDGGSYKFHNGSGVFVSAAHLIFGLIVTLGYAFWNSWRLDRRLGVILMGIWATFTIVNIAISMTV